VGWGTVRDWHFLFPEEIISRSSAGKHKRFCKGVCAFSCGGLDKGRTTEHLRGPARQSIYVGCVQFRLPF
jgi:hypothetical protein